MWHIAGRVLFSIVLALLAGLVAANAQAAVPRISKEIDGVTAYLGVVPSAFLIHLRIEIPDGCVLHTVFEYPHGVS